MVSCWPYGPTALKDANRTSDFIEVYDQSVTGMNIYRGGVFQQALSGVTNLNNNWYDGKQYQTYAFEYTPGTDGDVVWFVGKDKTWKMDAKAVGPNGNIGQRVIPVEPMTIIINYGMSMSFAALNLTGLAPLMPATMKIDYIRLYQDPNSQSVTCDPPGYETTEYIANHMDSYANANLTTWYGSRKCFNDGKVLTVLRAGTKLPTPGPKIPLSMVAKHEPRRPF